MIDTHDVVKYLREPKISSRMLIHGTYICPSVGHIRWANMDWPIPIQGLIGAQSVDCRMIHEAPRNMFAKPQGRMQVS
jgi:hypothetical protein